MEYKIGKLLWNTIEDAAREKYGVGEDFILTMVDLGDPKEMTYGECECRINSKFDNRFHRGFVTFNPYI